jgi:tetratricopeptide (TPR) repeat protein
MRLLMLLSILFLSALTISHASDVGDVSFPNSGSQAAQSDFLRGLALLHSFEYEDAATAFQKAEQIDPGFALAYWGEAMTYNHPIWMEQDRDAAVAALKKLGATPQARAAKAGTQREKDYLQAVEILYGDGEKNQRDLDYADAMRALHETYPDDPEASLFYALSLLGTAHQGRDFTIYMRAAAILEVVFHDHPNHPGAAHYLIHCYDDPVHAPLGLRAASVYSKIAPAAAHAQHMISHIYMALGMWDEVVAANEIAVKKSNEDSERRGGPKSGCGHYNEWLLYGYLQQGRFNDAKNAVNACRETVVSRASTPPKPAMPGMRNPAFYLPSSFVSMWGRYVLDTEDWKGEVAGWTVPMGSSATPVMTRDYIEGLAAAEQNQMDAARGALERVKKDVPGAGKEMIEAGMPDASFKMVSDIIQDQLNGMILLGEGKSDQAVSMLRQAAKLEEELPFAFGPPEIDKPSRELLGEVLLKLKRPKEAYPEFQAALARTPRRTASLLGLARSAEQSGNQKAADEAYAQLRQIWQHADHPPINVTAVSKK